MNRVLQVSIVDLEVAERDFVTAKPQLRVSQAVSDL